MTIAETCHLYRGFPPISIDPRKCAKYSSQEAMSKWPQLGGDFDFRKKIGGFSFFLHTFSSFQKDKKKKKQTHLDFCTGLHDLSFHHSQKEKTNTHFCIILHIISLFILPTFPKRKNTTTFWFLHMFTLFILPTFKKKTANPRFFFHANLVKPFFSRSPFDAVSLQGAGGIPGGRGAADYGVAQVRSLNVGDMVWLEDLFFLEVI